ncbi:2-oxoglutarate-dependent dioxygenase gloF [Colletotrichum spaethianum]|uniref:2-oxoglutarate-dependent dioxygenase gloF n=1 Tax=Colletotrichum spaethianum TaxID=700344 RepID=A0AA37LAX0_9PEZI|nr:2-oxoglutarate-dependent dioxygenase gloF [Colletotrichum spaethianum]GKT45001.1 2-oxoglutarate-dependent dioxygenase gloF [Colletotrichum spaethianum]
MDLMQPRASDDADPGPHSDKPTIPLIDLGGLEDGAEAQDALQTGKDLVNAFRTAGFAYIKNHGIPEETLNAAFQWRKTKAPHPPEGWWHRGYSGIGREKVSQMIFDAEQISELRKVPDFKESYEIGREDDDHLPNIWIPEESLPGFRSFFNNFYEVCYQLELHLLRAMALGMGLNEDFFQRYHVRRDNQIRLLHYPPVEEKPLRVGKVERLSAHTDFGSMTLLFQDDVGGLEVEDPNEEGKFVPVSHIPGTIVVNIGDFMQRWSNDTLRSTMHRVRAPPLDTNESGSRITRARYSIPYFIGADQEKTVDCIPGCFGPGRPKKYGPINSREYIEMRLNATY